MKGKFVTLQVRLACLTKPVIKEDLYRELETTIQEQKRIMQSFMKPGIFFIPAGRKKQIAM